MLIKTLITNITHTRLMLKRWESTVVLTKLTRRPTATLGSMEIKYNSVVVILPKLPVSYLTGHQHHTIWIKKKENKTEYLSKIMNQKEDAFRYLKKILKIMILMLLHTWLMK